MSTDPYTGKPYTEMTSQERYDRLVKDGKDPHGQGRAFCHDCGYFPAFKPRVLVCNAATVEVDVYTLDMPHLCGNCSRKRGLPSRGFLIPKTEAKNVSESIDLFMETYPAWVKQLQEKSIKDLMDQGMGEKDARGMMGYTK